jgi:hypothetical protein
VARDRSDTRWQHLEQPWQRLLWARETAGFRSGAAFARKVGEKEHTYKAYERDADTASKGSKLDFVKARSWAPLLEVRWEWLLNGEGLPWIDEDADSAAAQISRLVEEAPPEEQQRALDLVRVFLKRAG